LPNGNFPQRVKFTATRQTEADFAAEKKVELTIELTFRPPSTFGDRLDQTICFREPVNDQAGFRQAGEADHDGFRGWHAVSFEDF
jgi:hypothetical protein